MLASGGAGSPLDGGLDTLLTPVVVVEPSDGKSSERVWCSLEMMLVMIVGSEDMSVREADRLRLYITTWSGVVTSFERRLVIVITSSDGAAQQTVIYRPHKRQQWAYDGA